jgi:hypothetical protein
MQVAMRTTCPAKLRPSGRPTLNTAVKVKTVSTRWASVSVSQTLDSQIVCSEQKRALRTIPTYGYGQTDGKLHMGIEVYPAFNVSTGAYHAYLRYRRVYLARWLLWSIIHWSSSSPNWRRTKSASGDLISSRMIRACSRYSRARSTCPRSR